MLIVESDRTAVDQSLFAGVLHCPSFRGELRPADLDRIEDCVPASWRSARPSPGRATEGTFVPSGDQLAVMGSATGEWEPGRRSEVGYGSDVPGCSPSGKAMSQMRSSSVIVSGSTR